MEIDRSKFLALAFGMAGTACNTGPAPVVAATVVEIPPQPPQPANANARVATAKVSTPPATAPPPVEEDGDPVEEDGDVVSGGCGEVDITTVVRPKVACVEDKGVAPACNAMKSCNGFAFPTARCADYRTFFKPKVAERAVACLNKLTAKQVCDACNAYRCGDHALKTSCPDTSADAQCAQIVRSCRTVSMADCRMYLSGMNNAGRAKMVSCLTNASGCGFGIYSCVESL